MSDTDAVTWGELKEHCRDKQGECQRYSEARLQNLIGDAIKGVLSDKSLIIFQRPVFYLLAAALVAAGAGGAKIAQILGISGP